MTFIDLFAGIGGFRLALESQKLRCVFSSEINPFAQKTYLKNFGETPFGDIKKIKNNKIPKFNILCAGFPCQSFSTSGNSLGLKDPRGALFFEILRIIKFHKPQYFILENVPRLKNINQSQDYQCILKSLKNQGYHIKDKVLNSKHFGVPQDRPRLFIIGFLYKQNYLDFMFPVEQLTKLKVKDILEPKPPKHLYLSKYHQQKLIPFKAKKPNPNKPLRIFNIGNKKPTPQGFRVYSSNALSIVVSSGSGGLGAKSGLYQTSEGIRRLSVRESARLQAIPDNFLFPVSETQAFKQIGNSLTISIPKKIIKNIIKIS